jgi:hypothetical protein
LSHSGFLLGNSVEKFAKSAKGYKMRGTDMGKGTVNMVCGGIYEGSWQG